MDTSQTVELRCANGKVVQRLPPLCMACGRPATQNRQWTASTQPLWATILTSLMPSVDSLGSREVALEMPLCDECNRARGKVIGAVVLGSVITGLAAILFILVMMNESLAGLAHDLFGEAYVWVLVLFVAIAAAASLVLVRATASSLPRVQHIDDHSVTIKGVSDKFRRALLQMDEPRSATPALR